MATYPLAGEWTRMPRLNAPIPESVIHLPVGYRAANGGHVNIFLPEGGEVASVHVCSKIKTANVHEVLAVIACYDPVNGTMEEFGRALHEPYGPEGKPEPSTVDYVQTFRTGSVVVKPGHVIGVWAVGGGEDTGGRFTKNWWELACTVELLTPKGFNPVIDWPRTTADRAAVPKMVDAMSHIPDFMRRWCETRAMRAAAENGKGKRRKRAKSKG